MSEAVFEFNEKVLLLTGAAGGIAQRIARVFHAGGADLVLADLRREQVDEFAATLEPGLGRVVTASVDAGDPESVQQLVDLAVAEFTRIDVVVPAAGIYPARLVSEMSDAEWRRVLSINLDGVFYLLRRVIPHLADGAAIVNIASVAGHRGSHSHAHYSASKAGIIALTRSLALELGPKVRVNAVSPGTILTPMTDDLIASRGDALLQNTPLGRNGEAQEVADVIAFLATDTAGYINGEVVHVNGGLFMAG